ncbi:MAG: hypothetical protein AAF558_02385 [Verrucomicrobiota bacterium]
MASTPEPNPASPGAAAKSTPLSSILGAILQDLTKAQDTSNRYSAKLSQIYKNREFLRQFPVPNGLLTELEMELKVAVNGVDTVSTNAEDLFLQARTALKQSCQDIANRTIQSVSNFLETADPGDLDSETFATLKENLSSPEFTGLLNKKLNQALVNDLEHLFSTSSKLDVQATGQQILSTVDNVVLQNPDLSKFLDTKNPKATECLKTIQADIISVVKKLPEVIKPRASFWENPEMNVIADASTLSSLPDLAVGSIKIKAELRDYKWVINVQKSGQVDRDEDIQGHSLVPMDGS